MPNLRRAANFDPRRNPDRRATHGSQTESRSWRFCKRAVERLGNIERRVVQKKAELVPTVAALKEIRNSALYRKTRSTFEQYCQERWGLNSQTFATCRTIRGGIGGVKRIRREIYSFGPNANIISVNWGRWEATKSLSIATSPIQSKLGLTSSTKSHPR